MQFLSTEGDEWVEPTNNSSAGRPYFEELFRNGRGGSDFNPLLTFSLSKNDFLRGSAEIMVWVQVCFFAALRLHSALDVMPKNTVCIEKLGVAAAGSDSFRALLKAPFSLLISQLIGLDQNVEHSFLSCGASQPLQLSMAASCLLITDDIIIIFIFTLQSQSVQKV